MPKLNAGVKQDICIVYIDVHRERKRERKRNSVEAIFKVKDTKVALGMWDHDAANP